jgi:TolA-binding protein
MQTLRTFILLLAFVAINPHAGANTPEAVAFETALKQFEDQLYESAEKRFDEFVSTFPQSERRAEAILYQARSRYFLTNYIEAAELLQTHLPAAGPFADRYRYRLGETVYEQGNFQQAAEIFAEIRKNFPKSPLRLESCYSQALALSRLQQWSRVMELLQEPGGDFQEAVQALPNNPLVIEGQLLLAEAFLHQQHYSECDAILNQLRDRTLRPESKWKLEFLRCRIHVAEGRLQQAIVSSTNVHAAAVASDQPRRIFESNFLKADILERLNRLPEAIQVYERNLAETASAETRRRALRKVIQLSLAQSRPVSETIKRLETYIEQYPSDPSLDLARFTFGELRLKEYAALPPSEAAQAGTNLLQQAMAQFNRVTNDYPETPLLGQIHLNRGWCFWAKGRLDEARGAFEEAVGKLPFSEHQAVALFKLADVHFQQRQFPAAASAYNLLLQTYSGLEPVRRSLFPHAHYQLLRAHLANEDREAAHQAMRALLDTPENPFADKSLLLMGQNLLRRDPAEARKIFEQFLELYPESDLLPVVRLEIGRTYRMEQNWPVALEFYNQWVQDHASDPLLPDGEYARALAHWKAGLETNSLNLFTNFVARFPSSRFTPLAVNWIADYHWNRQEYVRAEMHYQRVFQHTNAPRELAYHARFRAGQAAFAGHSPEQYNDARNYFTTLNNLLTKDPAAPHDLIAKTRFAIGETMFHQFIASPAKPEKDFADAVTVLRTVSRDFPNSRLAPLAEGRIGQYYLQFAALKSDPTAYGHATNAFWNVIASPLADLAARSEAEVGLGKVLEQQGQPKLALAHYEKVVYENDGREFDPGWVREAGLSAARIYLELGQGDKAQNIYKRLIGMIPALESTLQRRIDHIRTEPVSAGQN